MNKYIKICVCVCECVSESHLHLTLCDSMDCSPPGSSVRGILQARTLEWVAISSSWGSFWPRDRTWVSCIAARFCWVTGDAISKSVSISICIYIYTNMCTHLLQIFHINIHMLNIHKFMCVCVCVCVCVYKASLVAQLIKNLPAFCLPWKPASSPELWECLRTSESRFTDFILIFRSFLYVRRSAVLDDSTDSLLGGSPFQSISEGFPGGPVCLRLCTPTAGGHGFSSWSGN